MKHSFRQSFSCRFVLACLAWAAFQMRAWAALPFVHPVFTSDMVMQREVTVPVWGWTTPGITPTLAADRFIISIPTVVGKNYRIEKSTDLIDWSVLLANTTGTGGLVVVEDPFVTPPPKVFYRAVAY